MPTLMPSLLYAELPGGDTKIKSLVESAYGVQLLLAYHVLRTDRLYQSFYHGQGHIERVMLLGALIAKEERLSPRETKLLLFCCSYHDIGRIDEGRDDLHGRRSAERIVGDGLTGVLGSITEGEIAAMQAAITIHSLPDGMLSEIMDEYHVPAGDRGLCKTIGACLKDADNLDRVRLGDLDPAYLRHRSSRNMVGTAEYLFRAYTKAQRNPL